MVSQEQLEQHADVIATVGLRAADDTSAGSPQLQRA